MATSFEVIRLGTLAKIDTTQGNEVVENAGGILGTYGSAANPLSGQVQTLAPNSLTEDDNNSYDLDNGGGFDSFRINGGAAQNFDASSVYNAVITYTDGSTATITATVFQDVNGNTYLAPEDTANADQSALTAKPIQSLSLNSVSSNTGDMAADRVAGDFKAPVDGTGGNDSMGVGYTDAQGDMITSGADVIYGGSGNDVVSAGGGGDLVFGGAGDDSLNGGAGNDNLFGGDGADTFVFEDGFGSDTITAGESTGHSDIIDLSALTSGVSATVNNEAGSITSGANAISFSQVENFTLTDQADTVSSQYSAGTILAGGGNDRVTTLGNGYVVDGGAGNDSIGSTSGQVSLYGGIGDDTLALGFNGRGLLDGGDGNDQLLGSHSTDTIYGGAGNDTIRAGGAGADVLVGGSGADLFLVNAIGGTPGLTLGNATIDGGEADAATDTITFASHTAAVTVTYTGSEAATFTDGVTSGQFTGVEALVMTAKNDVVNAAANSSAFNVDGGTGNDSLTGGSGSDTLTGGSGDDTLYFGTGDNVVYGGDGADLIDDVSSTFETGNNLIYGGIGNDTIWFGAGNTTVYGGDGNDYIDDHGDGALAGLNLIDAGTGNDTVWAGNDADTIFGGAGLDSLVGQAGTDSIDGGADNDTLYGDAGADTLLGGDGNDALFGGDDNDSISGGYGNDSINAGAGGDWVTDEFGGNTTLGGADTVDLGDGNDVFVGSGQNTGDNDLIYGGLGADTITVREAYDTVYGGDGNDSITTTNEDSIYGDALYGDAGDDTITGANTDDTLYGGTGADRLFGGDNTDTLYGGDNADSLDGGSESDWLEGGLGDDTLVGGTGADNLMSGDGNDRLFGDAGNDSLSGGSGSDGLWGGEGNDALDGGTNDDTLVGGSGADTLVGGDGRDTAYFHTSTTGVSVNLATGQGSGGDAAGDVLSGVENLVGSSQADTFVGDGGANALDGRDGNDTLTGGGGADSLTGGEGTDTADYAASGSGVTVNLATGTGFGGDAAGDILSGIENVTGSALGDSLTGDATANVLRGGDGDDTLTGGAGNDTIATGSGADTVSLADAGGSDVVTDFDLTLVDGKTTDQLDVSSLTNASGNPVTWRDVTVTDTNGDGTGDAILTFPNGESIILQGITPDQVDSREEMVRMGIPCFAAGSTILTPSGPRAVETLARGDLVQTQDGPAPVIWAGSRSLGPADLAADPNLLPIHFAAGVIGNTLPLRLSQQHAVQIVGADGSPVLVRAKHMAEAGLHGVRIARGVKSVTYHHLLLQRHSTLSAAGAPVESMYPGPIALASFPVAARLAIAAAIIDRQRVKDTGIIDLSDLSQIYGPRCLPLLGRKDALLACRTGGALQPFAVTLRLPRPSSASQDRHAAERHPKTNSGTC